MLRKDSDTKGDVNWWCFNNSMQMNSRKQVSNEFDDTLEGDEQIRPMVSFQVQEIVDGDRRGGSWTGTGGWIGEEEDRGWGGHTEDDTEG